jgi:hypothetical protein
MNASAATPLHGALRGTVSNELAEKEWLTPIEHVGASSKSSARVVFF